MRASGPTRCSVEQRYPRRIAATVLVAACRSLFCNELALVRCSRPQRFIARIPNATREAREPVPGIERARPIIEGRFVVSVINVIVKSLLDNLLRPGILRMPETRVGATDVALSGIYFCRWFMPGI